MTFSDWVAYDKLLNELGTFFARADSLESLRGVLAGDRPDLVDGEHGFTALVTGLSDSGDYSGDSLLFEHLRLVTLAVPAELHGMGEEWAGSWISADHEGARVYAGDRYAALSAWFPLPLDDSAPDAPEADPLVPRLDEATGRWRRFAQQDGEYEYHHLGDDVWERVRDGLWHRHHDGAGRWLAYDEPSRTWLDGGQWRHHDDVGKDAVPDPAPPADAVPTEETPAEDVVLTAMATEYEATVKGVRELGISPDELSDDEIFELFGQRAEQLLAEQVPELGKQD